MRNRGPAELLPEIPRFLLLVKPVALCRIKSVLDQGLPRNLHLTKRSLKHLSNVLKTVKVRMLLNVNFFTSLFYTTDVIKKRMP